MTSDEMERGIEFLLKSQANFEIRLEEMNRRFEETNRQIAQTNQLINIMAETQNEFTQAVTRFMQTQDKINARLTEATTHHDERVNVLVETVERLINQRGNEG